MFEVPAGGRRYRALELLVKQKRMAKTQPVPCVVRDGGIAEDDSLAENDERVGLHPLDQFRAFQSLRAGGMSEEEIAARHFVTPAIVKQRLRLASVSPKLHDVYADDGMTLEQLMAFTVTGDHARQEQIWDSVSRSGNDEPYRARGYAGRKRRGLGGLEKGLRRSVLLACCATLGILHWNGVGFTRALGRAVAQGRGGPRSRRRGNSFVCRGGRAQFWCHSAWGRCRSAAQAWCWIRYSWGLLRLCSLQLSSRWSCACLYRHICSGRLGRRSARPPCSALRFWRNISRKSLPGEPTGAESVPHRRSLCNTRPASCFSFGRLKLGTIPKSLIRQPLLSTSRFRSRHGFGSCFPRVRIDSRQKLTREPCSDFKTRKALIR
jgi:hypothetical protein